MSVCSNCTRVLRKPALPNPLLGAAQLRCLSTSFSRRQQPAQSPSQQQQAQPAVLPTTTSTVTSNVTTSLPPAKSTSQYDAARAAQNAPPTSTMQQAISSNLSRQGNSLTRRLAESLRKSSLSSVTDSYITYGITEALFKSCGRQAEYTIPEDQRMGIYTGKGPPKNAEQEDVGVPQGQQLDQDGTNFWFDTMQLEPTFSTWSQVSFLHMYILTVKLRTLPNNKDFLDHQRYLLEHFSNAAEDKMALLHGMTARGIRNKHLKDLFVQWRGVLYAYDQGLVQGDAVLGAAVWRNVWKAKEDVDWEKVAMIVGFIRRSIAGLENVDVQEIARGLDAGSPFWEEARQGLMQQVRR